MQFGIIRTIYNGPRGKILHAIRLAQFQKIMLTILYLLFSRRDVKTTAVVDLLLKAQIDRCIQSPKFCNFPWLGGTDVAASTFTTVPTKILTITTTAITTTTEKYCRT